MPLGLRVSHCHALRDEQRRPLEPARRRCREKSLRGQPRARPRLLYKMTAFDHVEAIGDGQHLVDIPLDEQHDRALVAQLAHSAVYHR